MWRISIFLSTCMSHPTVASLRSRAGGTPLQEALPQEGQEALLNERGEGPPQREPLSGSPARPESLLYLPREAQSTQAVLTPTSRQASPSLPHRCSCMLVTPMPHVPFWLPLAR